MVKVSTSLNSLFWFQPTCHETFILATLFFLRQMFHVFGCQDKLGKQNPSTQLQVHKCHLRFEGAGEHQT